MEVATKGPIARCCCGWFFYFVKEFCLIFILTVRRVYLSATSAVMTVNHGQVRSVRLAGCTN